MKVLCKYISQFNSETEINRLGDNEFQQMVALACLTEEEKKILAKHMPFIKELIGDEKNAK